MTRRFLPGLMVALLALLVIPTDAQSEIDPDALPPWDKVALAQGLAFDVPDFGTLRIAYPEGWSVMASDGGAGDGGAGDVNIASNPDLLAPPGPSSLQPGDIVGIFMGLTDSRIDALRIPANAPNVDLLVAVLDDLTGDTDDVVTLDAPATIALGQQRVIMVSGRAETGSGEVFDLLAFVTQPDGMPVFSLFFGADEGIDQYDLAEIFAVVAGLRVDTSGGPEGDVWLARKIMSRISSLGRISLWYPEDYVASDQSVGVIYVASSQDLLDTMMVDDNAATTDVAVGEFGLFVFRISPEIASRWSLDTGNSLGEGLSTFIALAFDGEVLDATITMVEETVINRSPAAIASMAMVDNDIPGDGTFVLMQMDDGYVLMLAIAAEGSMEEYDAVLRAIAASVEYVPPETDSDF